MDFLEYTDFSPPAEGKGQWKWERRLVAFVVRRDRPIVRLDLGPGGADRRGRRLGGGQASAVGPPPLARMTRPPRCGGGSGSRWRRTWRGCPPCWSPPTGPWPGCRWAALPGQQPGDILDRGGGRLPSCRCPRTCRNCWPSAVAMGRGRRPRTRPSLLLVGDVDYGASPGSADARGHEPWPQPRPRAGSLAGFGRLRPPVARSRPCATCSSDATSPPQCSTCAATRPPRGRSVSGRASSLGPPGHPRLLRAPDVAAPP